MRKSLSAFVFCTLLAPFASAGIVRHIVKPVARKTAQVSKTVAQKTVHATKAVVY